MAVCFTRPRLAAVRDQGLDYSLYGLLDDAGFVGIALEERLREVLRLLERDVRRQRGDVGVGDCFQDDRPVALQGGVPRVPQVLRFVDADAPKPDALGEVGVREVRQVLAGLELDV